MKDLIGYCGLDCEKCEARIATINNDNALREKVAQKWSELNGIEITSEMINCVGCRIDGPKTPYCESLCEIKKCAINKKHQTCAYCKCMGNCQTLSQVTSNSAEALTNLQSN